MSKGIRLSEKHGVNPSLTLCPICQKENGALALLGRLPNDAEAPRQMIDPFHPCDACNEKYLKEGVLVLESAGDRKRPNPTGRIVVVRVEAWRRIMTAPVPPKHIAFMEPDAFSMLFSEVVDWK